MLLHVSHRTSSECDFISFRVYFSIDSFRLSRLLDALYPISLTGCICTHTVCRMQAQLYSTGTVYTSSRFAHIESQKGQ